MRIVMPSWEYPPLVVGGLAAHVDGLSRALARAGHEVVVLTRAHPEAPNDADVAGVRVLRASQDTPWMPPDNPLAGVVSGNHHLALLADTLRGWDPDVVHAHDWLTAWVGDALRARWGVPMVATVHATEMGRHQGHLWNANSMAINSAEWWLTYQAKRVICASHYMVGEVLRTFQLPPEKVDLVPNGVDPARWREQGASSSAERAPSEAPLILGWGRLEFEKGFQTLIAAMRSVADRFPAARCELVGWGTYGDELRRLTRAAGVEHLVHFAGFVSEDSLVRLLARASCVVIPSLYEPFGIVALEALAAEAPLVASDTGGLHEILSDTGAALLFPPGDPNALADQVSRMLQDPELARACQRRGAELLASKYTWDAIAGHTVEVYLRAGAGESIVRQGEGVAAAG